MQTSSIPTIAWTRILGTSGTAENISLTTGLDGSIYVSGSTNVSFDGQTISGGWDTYITKYTPDGTKVWTRLLGSSSTDISYAITTGLDGSIYVSGRTQGSLDLQINSGGNDAFISKYNPDGTKVWTRLLGTSGEEYGVSLTAGPDGSIYLGGSTTDSLDGQPNSGISTFDAFITKFTADGTKVWTRLLGSRVDQYARATTTSQDGSIYTSGDTWSSMDGQAYIGGQSDVFITKYTPDGTKVWTRLLGSSSGDYACAMTSGLDGSIFVCGFTTGSMDGQSNNGGLDAFVSKYNPDGTLVWTRMIGTDSSDRANALTIDSDGSVYVSGWTTGSLDGQAFGGNTDAFVTKYDPDGAKIWTRLFGTSSSESSTALTKGTDGSIYLGGWTTDSVDGLQIIKGGSDAFIIKLVSTSNPTPTIAISSNNLTLKTGETALITFTLSDVSSNFNSSDVNCIGGVLANFSGSGTTYTAIFIPSTSSIISGTIKVASAVFTDEAGNLNADGSDVNNTITIAVDTVIPTIALSASKTALIAGETTNLSFTLSETSTTFTASDISVVGGALSNFVGSGTNYTALFTPTANSITNGSVSVASGVFADAAGNVNADGSDANNTVTITVNTVPADTKPPTTVATYFLIASSTSIGEGSSAVFTLTTTNLASGTAVPYTLSGISGVDIASGILSGNAVINSSGAATISVSLLNDLLTEGAETLTITIGGATASTVINDTSKSTATYLLNADSASSNEGSSATFTLTTTNLSSGTLVPYTLSGVSSADISGGSLNGNAVISSSGVATVSVSLINDLLTEGDETLTITAGGVTASTVIKDTSKSTSTYTLSVGNTTINEGEPVAFLLSTTGIVASGTSVPYALSGISSSDIVSGLLSGNVVINSSGYTFIFVTLINDSLTEGTETLTVTAGDASASIYVLDTSTSKKTGTEKHNLSVLVDKGVLGPLPTLLKNLSETMVFANGIMTTHSIQYSGSTFDYDSIDRFITTVTRDGEFTSEFTKEINDYLGNELNITYSSAVKLVGVSNIDDVILSVAGADGNFIA